MANPPEQTPAGDKMLKEQMVSKDTQSKSGQSTQQYLEVEEIRDGVAVLRDSSLRMVGMVSSMNFALKSTEEQEAIIYAYQTFLNSLDFPVQLIIQSRQLDIDSYLETLRQKEAEQTTELLRIQTAEYIEYISQLVELSHIMSKVFYISVPLFPFEKEKKKGMFDSLFKPAQSVIDSETDFQRFRTQLVQRIDHVSTGMQGVGLRLAVLGTQELIELLYNTYNPATFQQENLADINKLDVSTGDLIPEDDQ
jgi:hypothetical protein